MSVRPIWIPSRTITVTVSSYNSGQTRMVRLTGPTGEAAMAAGDPKNWRGMIGWAADLLAGELGVALGQLDDEVGLGSRAERYEGLSFLGEFDAWTRRHFPVVTGAQHRALWEGWVEAKAGATLPYPGTPEHSIGASCGTCGADVNRIDDLCKNCGRKFPPEGHDRA